MAAAIVPENLPRPVVAYCNPRRVILFGSAARGADGPDSDYDLLVILDDDVAADKLPLAAGYASRRAHHRAADVIPCRESVFLRKRGVAGSLAQACIALGAPTPCVAAHHGQQAVIRPDETP